MQLHSREPFSCFNHLKPALRCNKFNLLIGESLTRRARIYAPPLRLGPRHWADKILGARCVLTLGNVRSRTNLSFETQAARVGPKEMPSVDTLRFQPRHHVDGIKGNPVTQDHAENPIDILSIGCTFERQLQ